MDTLKISKLDSFIRTFSEFSKPLLNGHVVCYMQLNPDKNVCGKTRLMAADFNLVSANDSVVVDKIRFAVTYLLKDVKLLRRRTTQHWERIVDILNAPFPFQPLEEEDSTTHDLSLSERVVIGSEDVSILDVSTSEVSELNVAMVCDVDASLSDVPGTLLDATVLVDVEMTEADTKVEIGAGYFLREDRCPKCEVRNKSILSLQSKLRAARRECRALNSCKIKVLQQSLRRKEAEVKKWKAVCASQKVKASPEPSQCEQLRVMKIRHTKMVSKLHETVAKNHEIILSLISRNKLAAESSQHEIDRLVAEKETAVAEKETAVAGIEKLMTELEKVESENSKLLEDNLQLTDQLDCLTATDMEEPARRAYGLSKRKLTYRSVISNVPVKEVSRLVQYYSQVFFPGKQIRMPHPSSTSRMVHELGVLALIQVGEALQSCRSASIAFDATTKVEKHFNTFSISTEPDKKTYAVSTARVAGGKTEDYSGHIIASLKEWASVYGDFMQLPPVEVTSIFQEKCKASLSDRAKVNACVVEASRNELEMQFIQLNCNVHPLDTVATKARECLATLDEEKNVKAASGKGNALAVDIIVNVSKLRYSHKGEPAAFKSFLRDHQLPRGTFVRYVGNRMQILFHMAGIIVKHADLLRKFLANKEIIVCKNLLCDLSKREAMVQLQALGLIGKLITGPWMTLVYKNVAQRSNLEFASLFQAARDGIQKLIEKPEGVMSAKHDVFGQPLLESDPVLKCLQETRDEQLFPVMKALLDSTKEVLLRQLERYLVGDLSKPTAEQLDATRSVQPHNMFAERCLGIADYLIRRAPNVSIGFLDSKSKAKANNTLEWLEKKPLDMQERLVTFAMHRGAQIREACKLLQHEIDSDIIRRMTELQRKKEKRVRSVSEAQVRKVMAEGGASLNHPLFHSVDSKQRPFLQRILGKEDLVGVLLTHKWESDGTDVVYNGRVVNRVDATKTKSARYTVSYWKGNEDDAEDFDLSVESLIADLLLGDLCFDN